MSSSIYQDETVSLTTDKSFSNPAYTIVSFAVTPEQLAKLTRFVTTNSQNNIGFDFNGMLASLLPIRTVRASPTSTFCSRYVTEALQYAGIESVAKLDPLITTPTKLYNTLTKDPNRKPVVHTVPHKHGLLLKDSNYQICAGT